MSSKTPSYINAFKKGELTKRKEKALSLLENCMLCPENCKVNRLKDEKGTCNIGRNVKVSSYSPHFGEEAPLVGKNGSGAIFFTHCNLLCSFCQNYDISLEGYGRKISDEELANIMIQLQNSGCHNINLVTPSHVVPQIISALEIAANKGLSIPLVYNTGGYDNVETLKLLDGLIDIYLPDFKFWNNKIAREVTNSKNYRQTACNAIKEMYRQVGDLELDNQKIAIKGLIIRHLVLPGNMGGVKDIMKFIAKEISINTYVNIMAQYKPCGKALLIDEFNRKINWKEYNDAIEAAKKAGLKRIDKDEF